MVSQVLREIGSLPTVRLWRANAGAARDPRSGRVVRFGVPGQADLSGILLQPVTCEHCGHVQHVGRRLEVECKSATGRQSEQQRAFQAMVERFGGLYVLARSVEDARRAVE